MLTPSGEVTLMPHEVGVHKFHNPKNPKRGLAPLAAAREAVDGSLAAERFNRRLFDNSGMPQGVVSGATGFATNEAQLERERAMDDLVEETSESLARQEELKRRLEQNNEKDELSDQSPKPDGELEMEDANDLENTKDSEGTKDEADSQNAEDESTSLNDEEMARLQEKLSEQTKALEQRLEEELSCSLPDLWIGISRIT